MFSINSVILTYIIQLIKHQKALLSQGFYSLLYLSIGISEFANSLVGDWLLRLRLEHFIYTKVMFLASHVFAIARSRHTRYALSLAHAAFRLLRKLTYRRLASLWGTAVHRGWSKNR